MSREIKFRAWDKEYKEYNHESPIALSLEGEQYNVWAYHPQKITSNRYVIEQYTGLKDKNGKEIYEGDIVKWTNGLNETMFYEVYFNECRATFLLNPIDGGMTEGMSDKKKPYIEVIGNIHENSELLEGKK